MIKAALCESLHICDYAKLIGNGQVAKITAFEVGRPGSEFARRAFINFVSWHAPFDLNPLHENNGRCGLTDRSKRKRQQIKKCMRWPNAKAFKLGQCDWETGFHPD